VLDANAAIAALHVHHTPVQSLLLRRFVKPVDNISPAACRAADEHGPSSRVVLSNSARNSGGMCSALRKKAHRVTKENMRALQAALCSRATVQQPLTCSSASAPVSIFTLG